MVDTQPNSIRKVLYANTLLLYFFIFVLSSSSPFFSGSQRVHFLYFWGARCS